MVPQHKRDRRSEKMWQNECTRTSADKILLMGDHNRQCIFGNCCHSTGNVISDALENASNRNTSPRTRTRLSKKKTHTFCEFRLRMVGTLWSLSEWPQTGVLLLKIYDEPLRFNGLVNVIKYGTFTFLAFVKS